MIATVRPHMQDIIIIITDTQVQDLQRLLVVRTLYEENIKFTVDQSSSSLDD
jgi:hypothetical protein